MADKSTGIYGNWGSFSGVAELPNAAGAAVQSSGLRTGDLATVSGALYVCSDATLGASVWTLSDATAQADASAALAAATAAAADAATASADAATASADAAAALAAAANARQNLGVLPALGSTIARWTGEDGATDTVGAEVLGGTVRIGTGAGPNIKTFIPITGSTVPNVAAASLRVTSDNALSLEAVFIRGGSATGSIMAQSSSGETEPDNYLYQVRLVTDGQVEFFSESGAGVNFEPSFDAYVAPGSWVHLVITIDPGTTPTVDGVVSCYLNGELIDSVTPYTPSTGGTNTSFYLGGSASTTDRFIGGALSTVMVHAATLDASTIASRAATALGWG